MSTPLPFHKPLRAALFAFHLAACSSSGSSSPDAAVGMDSGMRPVDAAACSVAFDAQPAPIDAFAPVQSADYDEMPLYAGEPPNFKCNAPAETVSASGAINDVSLPTLRRYPFDKNKSTGFAYLVYPGGGFMVVDMDAHAAKLAARVGPQGIAVFALKYRVRLGSTNATRDAILDAKRAVRLVRAHATEWGVSSDRIGIIGYSAGSQMALTVASSFDSGNAADPDPVERQSCRPNFVGSMSTWSFRASVSPFTFPPNVPPVFFCHAEDDTEAPVALVRAVDKQIMDLRVPTMLDIYPTGGHSTCHVGLEDKAGHNWPDKMFPWLQTALK